MIAQAIKVSRMVEADRHKLAEENEHLRDELRERYAFRNIIGNSAPIQQVYEQVAQVARTNTTVLIRGESGTGKEMIAHAIHYNSPRAKKPFIKVSAAALPESLIESELFGYERGAFTGAQATKKGRFELAEGGTLFLDEIGDLNPSTQVKLLRVLQEREIERLGGTTSIKINVRLIAATHQPLETLMEEGRFRADLYYRLAVFTIFAPPLRERKPDIMLLADHFVEKYAREHGKRIRRVSTPAIDMLTSYHWPGNVRELENTIERSVLVCDGGVIHGHHLPPTLQTAEASDTVQRQSLVESVAAFERDLMQDALKTTRGNRAHAARLLDTTERIFNYKVRATASAPLQVTPGIRPSDSPRARSLLARRLDRRRRPALLRPRPAATPLHRHEARHVAALGHFDPHLGLGQLLSVDAIELLPQRVRAPAHARVVVGRVRARQPHRLDGDQVFVQGRGPARQLHLADVAQEVADLVRANERRALQHLLHRRPFLDVINGVYGIHVVPPKRWSLPEPVLPCLQVVPPLPANAASPRPSGDDRRRERRCGHQRRRALQARILRGRTRDGSRSRPPPASARARRTPPARRSRSGPTPSVISPPT